MAVSTSRPHNAPFIVSGIALMTAIAALALTLVSHLSAKSFSLSAADIEEAAYDRVVRDLWQALEPGYRDMGLDIPEQSPATIEDALKPLIDVSTSLGPGG